MGRHAAPPTPPPPLPPVLRSEPEPFHIEHLPGLIVIGMLCLTAIITVLALAGAADDVAAAVFLAWGVIFYLRHRRQNT